MRIDAEKVRQRRRAEQERLLDQAREFAEGLDPTLGVKAVIVFGSVARGDFNVWSDVDVLVVADELPAHPVGRLDALGPPAALVQPLAWSPDELRLHLRRGNPIAREVSERGVWLVGDADDLALR